MIRSADLLALAARVEAADGADRALDAEIGAVTLKNGAVRVTDDGRRLQISPPPRRYTASLDAAASLVPEGWNWEVYSDGTALLWMPPAGEWSIRRTAVADAATPALALTAAALRAMAEEAGE